MEGRTGNGNPATSPARLAIACRRRVEMRNRLANQRGDDTVIIPARPLAKIFADVTPDGSRDSMPSEESDVKMGKDEISFAALAQSRAKYLNMLLKNTEKMIQRQKGCIWVLN